MITKQVKAEVIARLKRGFHAEDIAVEFSLPTKLVKEWADGLSESDLVSLSANMHAVEELTKGTVPLVGEVLENKEKVLKVKLEEVAVEIVDQTSLVVSTGDIVRAKTLQLCADTVSKLYATFITKGQAAGDGTVYNPGASDTFRRLMKP